MYLSKIALQLYITNWQWRISKLYQIPRGNLADRIHTVKSTVRSLTMRFVYLILSFSNTCNRNKFVRISRWISGFYITKSCKERHWTPFCPPNTSRGREYHFPVVRMFLREFSHKQCAETSVHKTTHPAVTKMTIVNFLVNVLQHNFNKQF